jgi:predicted MFS family arabinose efflux permease
LTIGSFALGLDAFVVAGILPIMSANLHHSVSAIGQMVTVFTLSYALLSPVFSTLLTGRSLRAVLLVALVVFTAGNVLTAMSSALPALLVARAVAGIGAGLYSPMSVAAAAGLVPAERRGRALAMITGGMSSGVVLGVPIGLALAQAMGWRATIWLVVGLTVIAFIGIAAYLPPLRAAASAPSLRARAGVLADRRVLTITLVTMACATASIGSYTYLSTLLGHALHATNLTLYLWAWGLGGLVGSFAVGQFIDRWADTRALVSVIAGVLGGALLLLPLADHHVATVLPALFIWGIAGWSSLAPQQHRMLAVREKDGTVAVSLNSSATYLGSSVGAGIGGFLLGTGLSATVLPLLFGGVAVLCALLNLATATSRPKRSAQAEDATARPDSVTEVPAPPTFRRS